MNIRAYPSVPSCLAQHLTFTDCLQILKSRSIKFKCHRGVITVRSGGGGSYKCQARQRYAKITASLPAHAVKFYSAELTNKSGFRRLSIGSNWSVYKTPHMTVRCSVLRRGSVLTAAWWNQSSCLMGIRRQLWLPTWRIKERAGVVACFVSPLIFFPHARQQRRLLSAAARQQRRRGP